MATTDAPSFIQEKVSKGETVLMEGFSDGASRLRMHPTVRLRSHRLTHPCHSQATVHTHLALNQMPAVIPPNSTD